jgi:hypothetical protein
MTGDVSTSISEHRVQNFLHGLFGDDLHAKRVLSLSLATLGAVNAASLSVHAIGQALATARGKEGKHGIKQVDRLLSNKEINPWKLAALWVPFTLGDRHEAFIALDWTDFDGDDQTTLVASLVTKHGRTTPLLWLTVLKSELKGMRNDAEDALLQRLREVIPESVRVVILADRGFADIKMYKLLKELRFDYIVRFRKCIFVRSKEGEVRRAGQWVPSTGHTRALKRAQVTSKAYEVAAVVCVKQKGMKEEWCLATSLEEFSSAKVVSMYGRRFTIEENFRDLKDIRFGMGLSSMHISDPDRRDRLLLVGALAYGLLTLLGAAGESLGMERHMKANTVKRRSYSLFRQGCYYYAAIPKMSEDKLRPLMERFSALVLAQPVFKEAFGFL